MKPPAIDVVPSCAQIFQETVLDVVDWPGLGSTVIFQAEVRHGVAHARHV